MRFEDYLVNNRVKQINHTLEFARHARLVEDLIAHPGEVGLGKGTRFYQGVVLRRENENEVDRAEMDIVALDGKRVSIIEAKTTKHNGCNLILHKDVLVKMYQQLCMGRDIVRTVFGIEPAILGVYRGGDGRGDNFTVFTEQMLRFLLGQIGRESLNYH